MARFGVLLCGGLSSGQVRQFWQVLACCVEAGYGSLWQSSPGGASWVKVWSGVVVFGKAVMAVQVSVRCGNARFVAVRQLWFGLLRLGVVMQGAAALAGLGSRGTVCNG